MSFLNDLGTQTKDFLSNAIKDAENSVDADDFASTGFTVPPIYAGDGNGLPSNKVPVAQNGTSKRKLIHWFVPEVGIVKMYVNPSSISYKYDKVIQYEKTKGGFVVQYWGEDLPKLSINGTTGSSGYEGINVLKEIYRAEQIMFDAYGLTLSATENDNFINRLIDSGVGALESTGNSLLGVTGGIVGGILGALGGADSLNTASPQQVPSLASLATGIEMFYSGQVFRGFFKSFSITESAEKPGLFEYGIEFVVTQERGYRTNSMPWHRSPIHGPSNNSLGGTPMSFGYRVG